MRPIPRTLGAFLLVAAIAKPAAAGVCQPSPIWQHMLRTTRLAPVMAPSPEAVMAPSPEPVPVSPQATIPAPEPSPTYWTSAPTSPPALPMPVPVVPHRSPELKEWALAAEAGSADLGEKNLKGGSNFFVSAIPSVGVQVGRALGAGMVSLAVQRLSYSIQDAAFAYSQHERSDLALQSAYSWRFSLGSGLAGTYGAGYLVRSVSVVNTASPPEPAFIFSRFQLYHGPRLSAGVRYALAPGISLDVDMSAYPYLFTSIEPGIPPLSTMGGYAWNLSLGGSLWGPLSCQVGYRQEYYEASSLELTQRFGIPYVTVQVRL